MGKPYPVLSRNLGKDFVRSPTQTYQGFQNCVKQIVAIQPVNTLGFLSWNRVSSLVVAAARDGEDMPKGPNGERRPTDANQLAHRVVQIATEQQEDDLPQQDKRRAGLAGAAERTKKLTPERRSEIARKAARARNGTRAK